MNKANSGPRAKNIELRKGLYPPDAVPVESKSAGPNPDRCVPPPRPPVQYRIIGVQSFIVGPDVTVYQTDLGSDTLKTFQEMDRFNLDKTWKPTNDEW